MWSVLYKGHDLRLTVRVIRGRWRIRGIIRRYVELEIRENVREVNNTNAFIRNYATASFQRALHPVFIKYKFFFAGRTFQEIHIMTRVTLESKPHFGDSIWVFLQSLEQGKPAHHIWYRNCRCVYDMSSNKFLISTNTCLEWLIVVIVLHTILNNSSISLLPLLARPYRLCGLVVTVPGYRSRGPGSIPGATRFSEK
jgi:hypothetical protein